MDPELLDVEKRWRIKIPKTLDLAECWGLIKPVVASEIGGDFYTPVPYLTETSAYKIGCIFVKVQNATGCCGGSQKSYKILGPINKFLDNPQTNHEWSSSQLPTAKSTVDFSNFQVRIGDTKNEAIFRGYDYHQQQLSDQIRVIGNLKLNRRSHEDLIGTKKIGLISSIGAVRKFEIRLTTEDSARIFFVGDGNHTIIFGYQVCDLDRTGTVVSMSNGRPNSNPWLSLRPKTDDDLPLWEA